MENITAKIATANAIELVQISYEVAIETIKEAGEFLNKKDYTKFKLRIHKAQSFITDLIESLDLSYEISLELMQLYLFINKLLIQGHIQRKPEPLQQASNLLNTLLQGWQEVAVTQAQPIKKSVMENTQKLYAGLTYGKGILNESIIDNNYQSRGFKA